MRGSELCLGWAAVHTLLPIGVLLVQQVLCLGREDFGLRHGIRGTALVACNLAALPHYDWPLVGTDSESIMRLLPIEFELLRFH